MIVKLKESVNNSISFSDSYSVFSYEDIPFVKKEAIDIWTSLPVGYALRIRNDNAVYIFEKTSEGMLRHETSKVIRTTTTKNHGNLHYTDYRTEKPYAVDSKYEQGNLKNTISHDTASLKIIDDRGQVVSHIKRDFFLEHRPELTEATASQPKALIVCPSCKSSDSIILTGPTAFADYDKYLYQSCTCDKCGCKFEANFKEVTDYTIVSYGSLDLDINSIDESKAIKDLTATDYKGIKTITLNADVEGQKIVLTFDTFEDVYKHFENLYMNATDENYAEEILYSIMCSASANEYDYIDEDGFAVIEVDAAGVFSDANLNENYVPEYGDEFPNMNAAMYVARSLVYHFVSNPDDAEKLYAKAESDGWESSELVALCDLIGDALEASNYHSEAKDYFYDKFPYWWAFDVSAEDEAKMDKLIESCNDDNQRMQLLVIAVNSLVLELD